MHNEVDYIAQNYLINLPLLSNVVFFDKIFQKEIIHA